MAENVQESKINESVAGASVGSVYFGIVNVFPQNWFTQILLALTPVVSVYIAFKWNNFFHRQRSDATSFEVENALVEARKLVSDLRDDPTISENVKNEAQSSLESIQILKINALVERVEKAVKSDD